MSTSPPDNYRPLSSLAVWVSILLVVQAVTAAVSALLNAYQVQLLDAAMYGSPILPGLAVAQDARQRLLASIELGLGLMAMICFLVWVYRANRNARALGAEDMEFSPGWSVGWFFVPFAGLFMPYFILKELWKASSSSLTGKWTQAVVSPVLGVWWMAFVIRAMLQYSPLPVLFGKWALVDSSRFGPGWLEHVCEFSMGRLFSDVVEITVSILTVIVVTHITTSQGHRLAAFNGTTARQVDAAP